MIEIQLHILSKSLFNSIADVYLSRTAKKREVPSVKGVNTRRNPQYAKLRQQFLYKSQSHFEWLMIIFI